MYPPPPAKLAFSLVELSIVLVILGLLVGGILSGQSLIHAAELRSVARDVTMLQTSMYSFRDKYMALPGDMTNASAFWGCANCNGNGDGKIANHAADAQISLNRYESSVVMQHLSSAGFINGTYTGNYVAGGNQINAADNAYASKINKAVFWIARPDVWGATSNLVGFNAICMTISTSSGCQGPQASAYAFYAEDGYNVDVKIDDGSARNGKLIADSCHINASHWGFDDAVIYRSSDASYEYDLSNKSISCGMMFLL